MRRRRLRPRTPNRNRAFRQRSGGNRPRAAFVSFLAVFCAITGEAQTIVGQTIPPGRCAAEGRVVNAVTGEPVRRATVTLRSLEPGGRDQSAVSDTNGHFCFSEVPPGRYLVAAERPGFLRRFGAPLELQVAPGARVSRLEVKILPQSVISGAVVDEDGEPVVGATVAAWRLAGKSPAGVLQPAGIERTDEAGEFRIRGLEPGHYLLAVSARPGSAPAGEGFALTFYPEATDLAGAAVLNLDPGQQLPGLVVRLKRVPVFEVSGRVVGISGEGIRGLRAVLRPAGSRLSPTFLAGLDTFVSSDGSFQIRGVPAGHYELLVIGGQARRVLHARGQVMVASGPVTDLVIPASSPPRVEGTARTEGGRPAGEARILLLPEQEPGLLPERVRVSPEGRFALDGVWPARYRVESADLRFFVKSVRLAGRESPDGFLDLSGAQGPVSVEVVLSDKTAWVEGTVETGEGRALRAWVTVIPEPPGPWLQQRMRVSAVDAHGRFAVTGLAPGNYRACAWASREPTASLDEPGLETLQCRCVGFALHEGGHARIAVPLIQDSAR